MVGGLLAASLLSGCSSTAGALVVSKTLEVVGLVKPEPPEGVKLPVPPAPPKVSLRIHAGEQLNTDPQLRSLSVVLRIYKLRSANAFLLAPYKAFGDAGAERQAFGNDLIDVREVVLAPGQKHEVVETLSSDGSYLAVAALFRAPADGRWRFAFPVAGAEKTGVTLGVHGCAMSVAAGQPEGAQPEALSLAGVRCS